MIIGRDGFYSVAYHDIMAMPQVRYYSHYRQDLSFFQSVLARLTFSKKVNQLIPYPFRRTTFPALFPHAFEQPQPLCFVFFGVNSFLFQSPYWQYLQKTYPDAKYVLYLQDIVSRTMGFDMERAKKQFDAIFSYDEADCSRYHLIYHPTPYSQPDVPANESIEESDIYFCGKSKDRLPIIESVYDHCTRQGLKCDFHVDEPMDYITNLQHIQKTRCILEVMQRDAVGFTPRLWESLFLGKHLLTDHPHLTQSRFYLPKQMHSLLNDLDTLPLWLNEPAQVAPLALRESLSPVHLLHHIQQVLPSPNGIK